MADPDGAGIPAPLTSTDALPMNVRKSAPADVKELLRLAWKLFGSSLEFDPWHEHVFVLA